LSFDAYIYRKARKNRNSKGTLGVLAKEGRQDFQQETEP